MVGHELFVVGYPYFVHQDQQGLATWIRATIATEPALNYGAVPCFSVDARTRKGQSGSPVLYHWELGIPSDLDVPFYPTTDQLIGVYSGRVSEESDLGFVWKKDVVREIIDGQHRPAESDLAPMPRS